MSGSEAYTPKKDLNDALTPEQKALLKEGDFQEIDGQIVAPDQPLSLQSVDDAVAAKEERETNLGD